MKFKVEIDCENGVFGEDRHSCNRQVAIILRQIVNKLDRHEDLGGSVRDLNGNNVGEWQYIEHTAEVAARLAPKSVTLGDMMDALLPSARKGNR